MDARIVSATSNYWNFKQRKIFNDQLLEMTNTYMQEMQTGHKMRVYNTPHILIAISFSTG